MTSALSSTGRRPGRGELEGDLVQRAFDVEQGARWVSQKMRPPTLEQVMDPPPDDVRRLTAHPGEERGVDVEHGPGGVERQEADASLRPSDHARAR